MALYNFVCDGPCRSTVRRILSPEKIDSVLGKPCGKPDCGGKWVREPTGATSQVYERLDNGLMPKAVERPKDAERLYKERAKKNG